MAHNLKPVVMIGKEEVTDKVIKEIDVSLNVHELIKVRVLGDDRIRRVAMIEEICSKSQSELVTHLGKLLVLYRTSEKKIIKFPKN